MNVPVCFMEQFCNGDAAEAEQGVVLIKNVSSSLLIWGLNKIQVWISLKKFAKNIFDSQHLKEWRGDEMVKKWYWEYGEGSFKSIFIKEYSTHLCTASVS